MMETHIFRPRNITPIYPFPKEFASLVVPDIAYIPKEGCGECVFGYPKTFKKMPESVGKVANLEKEYLFIVRTIHHLCTFPGVKSLSASRLFCNSESQLGFLPDAFTFGGGIDYCNVSYMNALLREFQTKRGKPLLKNRPVCDRFLPFQDALTKAVSVDAIRILCEKELPVVVIAPQAQLPSDESIARRIAAVPPEKIAPIVQIFAEDPSFENDKIDEDEGYEVEVDFDRLSDSTKRKLDESLPPAPEEDEKLPSADLNIEGNVEDSLVVATPSVEKKQKGMPTPVEDIFQDPQFNSTIPDLQNLPAMSPSPIIRSRLVSSRPSAVKLWIDGPEEEFIMQEFDKVELNNRIYFLRQRNARIGLSFDALTFIKNTTHDVRPEWHLVLDHLMILSGPEAFVIQKIGHLESNSEKLRLIEGRKNITKTLINRLGLYKVKSVGAL